MKRVLGSEILGIGKPFPIEVRRGAGAYVCGEETALLESLEGWRGMVRAKPPVPAIAGLFGMPTVVNNVLTLASVPTILSHSADFQTACGAGRQLEIHPSDASERGTVDGDWVEISSRTGEIALRATLSERLQPGVVFATFHFPESGTNRITTNNADWATQCPEYKLTAVQVSKMREQPDWQAEHRRWAEEQQRLLPAPGRDAGEVVE